MRVYPVVCELFTFCMSQVFRLTPLLVRGVVETIPPFTVDLQGVSIPRLVVSACFSCVQHFVRSPLFTQRGFFTDAGVGLLQTAIETADGVCSSASHIPWKSVMLKSSSKVISELTRCHNTVISLRKSHLSPRERWFNVESVASSISSTSPSRPRGVAISQFVEVGRCFFHQQKPTVRRHARHKWCKGSGFNAEKGSYTSEKAGLSRIQRKSSGAEKGIDPGGSVIVKGT